MNPDWQTFLQRQHAHLVDGVVEHFGNAKDELTSAQSGLVLCDLSQFGVLKVSGEEAQNFLHNLLSSDVRAVSALQAQISSLNTAKGRILATLLIWQSGADYFLQLPRGLCAATQKRLSMYVLRAKVKIEDSSDSVICLGLSGEGATALLQQHFGSAPEHTFTVEQHDNTSVVCVGTQRYQINTTPQHAPALWQNLAAGARLAGSPCWDWLNIRSGIPVITSATQEQFVPQMANLELIGGVNFKKGCYPGQEIVARMQYLGKLKRRMYLAHVAAEAGMASPAKAGCELFSAEVEEQSCGMVVNATTAPNGGYDLLAVVQISSRENHSIHLGSLQGGELQFLPLPYPV
jgi:folate-binding protein YgfZ